MSYDINHCTFSGEVQKLKRVDTRTGTPMLTFKLKCWKELIKIVAFKKLAEEASFSNGNRVKIKGRLQLNNWEFEGVKYRNFQIIADKVEVLEEDQPVQKKQPTQKVPEPVYREQVFHDDVPF